MNRIFFKIVVIVLLLLPLPVFAKGDLIWELEEDNFLENIDSLDSPINLEKKDFLEGEIRKILDIDVTYANLADCILTAAKNSYDLQISYHQKRSVDREFWAKSAELLPNFSYTFDIADLRGEFLVGGVVPIRVHETVIQSSFDLIWDITNQGKTIFEMAAIKNAVKSATYDLEYTLDEVLLNTALNYYDLLGKKLEIDVYRVNLKDREEQLKMIEAKYQIGLSSKFDIYRAEAEAAKARQEYITLFNSLRYSQARLANIMGIDVVTTVYPIEQTIRVQNIIDKDYGIEDLYKIAIKERDDLNSMRKNIKAMEIRQNEVYADFIPKIAIMASHQQVGTVRLGLRTNESLTLEVTTPLGRNLGVNTFTRAKMELEKIKAEKLRLKKMERQVKEDIINSYYDSKTQLEKIEAAKKEVVAAEESLKISLVRMDIGEATFLDVLQAQQAKTEARQVLIQHIVNYNKSQIQMLFNIGLITKCAVLTNYRTPDEG